jgi:hypothetical protein
MKITPWIAEWNVRRAGQSCNKVFICIWGARFEEQLFMVDREDYKKNTLPPDKTKLVDIQTTVRLQGNRTIWSMVKTYNSLSDGARSPGLVLLRGTTTRNAPS